MNHFLANEWDKARAQKRGGGAPLLPLQFDTAETRYVREPADNVNPEQHFERRWAGRQRRTVRRAESVSGRGPHFAAL
jgi:RNA polymerase sigma-70 factor (ECF subfamily)